MGHQTTCILLHKLVGIKTHLQQRGSFTVEFSFPLFHLPWQQLSLCVKKLTTKQLVMMMMIMMMVFFWLHFDGWGLMWPSLNCVCLHVFLRMREDRQSLRLNSPGVTRLTHKHTRFNGQTYAAATLFLISSAAQGSSGVSLPYKSPAPHVWPTIPMPPLSSHFCSSRFALCLSLSH